MQLEEFLAACLSLKTWVSADDVSAPSNSFFVLWSLL